MRDDMTWQQWIRLPEACLAILCCPELAIPPEDRRAHDILTIIRAGYSDLVRLPSDAPADK